MGRYVLSRLGQAALVVVGSLVLVFAILHVVAEPADLALPVDASAESVAAFNRDHGFDEPLLDRLGSFLVDAARGDFGESLTFREDALSVVLSRLPATAMLAALALVLSVCAGIGLGVLAAMKPDSTMALVLRVGSSAGISIADFWFGIMLILLVAVRWDALPTGGYEPKPAALVLPVIVASLRPTSRIFEMVRSTMAGEYSREYVLTARARGVSESGVAVRHVLRNAAIPIVTLVFYEMTRLLGGAAVVEVVFAWPGIGNLAVNALNRGDVFLVQAVVITAAATTALLNLLSDLLYFRLDPRTRTLVRQA